MRVPAFPRTHEKDTVSRVFDYTATIMKLQLQYLILGRNAAEHHVQKIVSTGAALLHAEALILKKSQGLAVVSGHAVNGEGARKLKCQNARLTGFRTNLDDCGRIERVVGKNRGLECIMQGAESNRTSRGIREPVGHPSVIKRSGSVLDRLSEEKLLIAASVHDDVERAGGYAVHPGEEGRPRIRRQEVDENTKSVVLIDAGERRLPLGQESRIRLWRETSFAKLKEQLIGRSICEAKVGAAECFVENRRPEKAAHLLLFDGITRRGKHMAAAGENRSGDASMERREEGEGPFFQRNDRIAAAKLDALFRYETIDLGRIDSQPIDGVVQFVRRLLGRKNSCRHEQTPQRENSGPNPHASSVVRFGMGEQGGRDKRDVEDLK